MPDSSNLAGKTAIVTGASRGIGQATALELARAGVNLVITARSLEALGGTLAELKEFPVQVHAAACDLSELAAVQSLVQDAVARFPSLDILINNAGTVEPIARLEDADPVEWARTLRINVAGPFSLCQAALPHLRAARGVIINLSSGAAHRALEGWSAYCASKAALAMLSQSLALELGGAGVRVYSFQPGVVDTDMQGQIRASGLNPVSQLPRAQLVSPRDPARVMAWLCRLEASDLNGQELSVNDPHLRQRAGLEAPQS